MWIDRKQKTDRWSGGGLDRTAAVSDLRPLTTSLLGRLNDQQTIYPGLASVLKTSTSCQNPWVFQDQHNWISRTDHKTIVFAYFFVCDLYAFSLSPVSPWNRLSRLIGMDDPDNKKEVRSLVVLGLGKNQVLWSRRNYLRKKGDR